LRNNTGPKRYLEKAGDSTTINDDQTFKAVLAAGRKTDQAQKVQGFEVKHLNDNEFLIEFKKADGQPGGNLTFKAEDADSNPASADDGDRHIVVGTGPTGSTCKWRDILTYQNKSDNLPK